MRSLVCLLLVAAACARTMNDDTALFNDFENTYGPRTSPKAFECFRKNLDIIDGLNMLGAEMHGVNPFTAMCPEEFKAYHNLQTRPNTTKVSMFPTVPHDLAVKLAASPVDWRTKGAVTHVKNQGQCGSCWSFSATGNMEGQHFLKGGKTLTALSEEELVQCSKNGNQGCNGGLMDNAFDWVVKNGGIDSESDYPYTSGGGITGTCKEAKLPNVVAKFSGHKDVAHDETQMAAWVSTNGPLSIAVDAGLGWQTYVGGIKKTCYAGQLDHGVLIVGYGESGSTPYWIVKNSWGASWGEHGYIRLERGKNCNGLKNSPSSATV